MLKIRHKIVVVNREGAVNPIFTGKNSLGHVLQGSLFGLLAHGFSRLEGEDVKEEEKNGKHCV